MSSRFHRFLRSIPGGWRPDAFFFFSFFITTGRRRGEKLNAGKSEENKREFRFRLPRFHDRRFRIVRTSFERDSSTLGAIVVGIGQQRVEMTRNRCTGGC